MPNRPVPDAALAARMHATAETVAVRLGLALDLESLDAVDGLVSDGDARVSDAELGAFVGEVLVRTTPLVWATASPRREVGVAIDRWLAQPEAWVATRRRRPTRSDHLRSTAEAVQRFAASPTEETAASLGWRGTRHPLLRRIARRLTAKKRLSPE